jgi:hypothetical protein
MSRSRTLALAQTVILAVAALVAATPAAHAADECLAAPVLGDIHDQGVVPDLLAGDAQATMFIAYAGDFYPPDYCSGVTATVQKTDGSLRRDIAFDGRDGTGMPPAIAITATLTVPLANGAGDWVVTKVTHGTESMAVSVPFRIRRGTTATIEQPPRVTSPAKTTITGVVRNYTPTGSLAISSGRTVALYGGGAQSGQLHLLGSARTDTTGRYRFQLSISAPVLFRVEVGRSADYGAAVSDTVTARVLASLSPLTASARGYIGVWWRVSAKAFPTTVFTNLQRWDGASWISTQSFGSPAADGSFTRWWKPDTAGTYRLRIELAGTGPDNLPIDREVSPVTVTARPATITGSAGPTSATVIRPGTKMSTYGHLTAMYTTGVTGPFAGQKVVVQTRPHGQTSVPYSTVATATTTSTGYYYANWFARSDVDVRVAFISPYQSVGSAFRWLRVVDVR